MMNHNRITALERSVTDYSRGLNPFMSSVPYLGPMQTVQDPDQTPQNVAFDKRLHCLRVGISIFK